MAAPRHVLLVRTDHLGDMLLTLPAARVLKSAHPQCRITVLASRANAAAAQHHADVDHVEIDQQEAKGSNLRGVRALAGRLRKLGCEAAVLFHPTLRLALALRLAGIPLRIGSAYRAYSLLFNRRVRQHRRGSGAHESSLNVALLAELGVPVADAPPVRWRVEPHETVAAERLLHDRGVGDAPFVVVHPGNAGSAMNWAAEQYADLARRLFASGLRIVVTGAPAERELTARVARAVDGSVDLGGATSLPELAALLQRATLYVGSSTGPAHLAAAVDTPVIALFSPLRSSAPARWRPLGQTVHTLQPAVDLVCAKCLGPQCPYWHCMQRHLSVDAVEEVARRIVHDAARLTGV